MKFLAKLSLFLSFITLAHAADDKPGFIRFVNLIDFDGAGKTNLFVNGADLYPKGYKPGQRSGGMGFPSGTLKVGIKHPGCKPVKESYPLKAGETQTILAYAVPVFDEDGKITEYQIKTARLQQRSPDKGLSLSLLSVVQEQQITVAYQRLDGSKKKSATINPMKVKRLAIRRAEADVAIYVPKDKNAALTFYPDESGNYVVIFYSKGDGSIGACQFYDPKFVVAG